MKKNLFDIAPWIALAVSIVIFLMLGFAGGFQAAEVAGGPLGLLSYYSQAFGFSLFECLDQLALMAAVFATFIAFYGIMRRFLFLFVESVNPEFAKKIDLPTNPWKALCRGGKKIGTVFLDLLPALLTLLVIASAFGEANGLDRSRLLDLSVIAPDHFLTGTYLFAWLGSFHWPHFLIEFIIGCFMNVGSVVVLPALLVGYVTPRVLKEMVVAFSIGMIILAVCWLCVPALSPQDRFIDNVYKLPIPVSIANAVADYHPQVEIADFLATIRKGKEGLQNLPTSTMPSAHVFWLGLAAYYFFKSKKWLGWIALPFIIASALGTVLLAQHYSLDVIASVVVVAISVWMARRLENFYKQ